MSDPYNSYPSNLPPRVDQARVSTPSIKVDRISRLDVSDQWKERFRAIEKAGGPELPNVRDLSPAERRLASTNWLAFFFWPIYLPVKGLWRQAVAYFLIGLAIAVLMELMGIGRFARAVGYGMGAVAMLRANISYYKRVVLDESPWV